MRFNKARYKVLHLGHSSDLNSDWENSLKASLWRRTWGFWWMKSWYKSTAALAAPKANYMQGCIKRRLASFISDQQEEICWNHLSLHRTVKQVLRSHLSFSSLHISCWLGLAVFQKGGNQFSFDLFALPEDLPINFLDDNLEAGKIYVSHMTQSSVVCLPQPRVRVSFLLFKLFPLIPDLPQVHLCLHVPILF